MHQRFTETPFYARALIAFPNFIWDGHCFEQVKIFTKMDALSLLSTIDFISPVELESVVELSFEEHQTRLKLHTNINIYI